MKNHFKLFLVLIFIQLVNISCYANEKVEIDYLINNISKKLNKLIISEEDRLLLNEKYIRFYYPNKNISLNSLSANESLSILRKFNYSITISQNHIELIRVKSIAKENLPDYNKDNNELNIVYFAFYKLKHVTTNEIRPLFRHISKITPPITFPDRKTFSIIAFKSDIEFFLTLLEKVDQPKN